MRGYNVCLQFGETVNPLHYRVGAYTNPALTNPYRAFQVTALTWRRLCYGLALPALVSGFRVATARSDGSVRGAVAGTLPNVEAATRLE